MYSLNSKSRQGILEATGMTVEQIKDMDFTEIDEKIAHRAKHKITKYIMDYSLVGRGQVYAETRRLIDIQEVDKELRKNDRRKSAFVRKTVSTIQ